jgi:hypothetical protein
MSKQHVTGKGRRKKRVSDRSGGRLPRSLGLEALESREVPSSATFLQQDETTQGNWQAGYGADGTAVAGATPAYPTYAQVSQTGTTTYTWASPTTDARALTLPGSTTKAATTWYGSTFTLDVNVSDGKAHQTALYVLDWDRLGRTERLDVLDGDTGKALDTRTLSGFEGGEYLSYNVTGHVKFQVTSIVGPNAVASGLFFAPPGVPVSPPPASPPASVSFIQQDGATQGNWQAAYGADGTAVAAATPAYPSYAQVSRSGASTWTWANPTTDARALTIPGTSAKAATTWYSGTYTLDVNLTDGKAHQVALYALDWDHQGRSERIDVLDAGSGKTLDTRILSGFDGGKYLSYNATGHVKFQVTSLVGPNAVLSGLFFGPAASLPPGGSATFTSLDTSTKGNWQTAYGTDGEAEAGFAAVNPTYGQVSVIGQSNWTWANPTTDVRALTVPGSTTRAATTWYGQTFTLDVNLTDGKAHPVALYALDWDNAGRSEKVDAIDANSGQVLDSRTLSSFSGGQYLDYTITGHVQFRVTNLSGMNAVMSGLFFGGAATSPPTSPPPATVNLAVVDHSTKGNWQTFYGAQGESIAGATPVNPTYGQVTVTGQSNLTWASPTTDIRALTTPGTTTRAATAWSGQTFTVDVNLTDGQTHWVALYLVDWDNAGRVERIDALDGGSGQVLHSMPEYSFSGGDYFVYVISGHVQFRVTDVSGPNAVLSGIFFGDSATSPATSPPPASPPTSPPPASPPTSPPPASPPTSPPPGVTVTSDWIITPTDKIPNFGGHPTVSAVQSGVWSSPATWGGQVPGTGAIVSIPGGMTVTYDQVSDTQVDTVEVQAGGTLQFQTNANTRLRVTNFVVLPNATLTIGTPSNPVQSAFTAQVIINNLPFNTTLDPSQYGHGLIGLGTVTMSGAQPSATHVTLAAEAHAGDTTLSLATPVTGWQAGSMLELSDTRQLYYNLLYNYTPQWETPTIAAVSADGRTITLSAPLAYDHLGARDSAGNLTFLPDVALVTRNVSVKSASASGVRGNVMFTERANVDIRGTMFGGLGRTTISAIDDTTYDSTGNVTHVGTNQEGRYPVYLSHVYGPTTTPADGYQFTFDGNTVICPVNQMVFKWGLTLNDSHYGDVSNNVITSWAGAGLVAGESGNESHNRIVGNYIDRVSGVGGVTAAGGLNAGVGLWLPTTSDVVDNNVVTNTTYGIVYFLLNSNSLDARVPVAPGSDTSQTGQYQTTDLTTIPIQDFTNNEVYGGLTLEAVHLWQVGFGNSPTAPQQNLLTGLKVWNVQGRAVYSYNTNGVTFNNMVARDNGSLIIAGLEDPSSTTGFFTGDYKMWNFKILNSDIQGFGTGIAPGSSGGLSYVFPGTSLLVQNTYLQNYADVQMVPLWGLNTSPNPALLARHVTLDNDHFALIQPTYPQSGWLPGGYVVMLGNQYGVQTFLTALDEVLVTNFNGNANQNFRVLYQQQSGNFVLPATQSFSNGTSVQTVSVSGLTNAQAWAQYGLAFAGRIASSAATTMTGIAGGLIDTI